MSQAPSRLAGDRPVPNIVTELPGPKARAHVEFDETWTSPSLPRAYPIVPVRGEGLTIEDIDGNLFLDFTAGIAVASTGHSHPQITAAIKRQAAELIHFSASDFYLPIYARSAAKLEEIAPIGPRRGRTWATRAPRRSRHRSSSRALPRSGRTSSRSLAAFHGRRYGSVCLTASKAKYHAGFGPLLPGVFHVPYGRSRGLGARRLQAIPANEIAAIIVEPIQGEGGYVVPEDDFLPGLRGSATRTESCSSPTRSSQGPDKPARCGRSSIGASSQTSCWSPRASLRACRSAR